MASSCWRWRSDFASKASCRSESFRPTARDHRGIGSRSRRRRGAQRIGKGGGCLKQAKIIRALAPAVEGPGKRRDRAFQETLRARRHLQDAERVRRIIVSLPDDKCAKNFATS